MIYISLLKYIYTPVLMAHDFLLEAIDNISTHFKYNAFIAKFKYLNR